MEPDDYQFVIKTEQLKQLLSSNSIAIFAGSIIAILMALVQSTLVDQLINSIWLAVMLSLNSVRIIIAQYYLKHPKSNASDVSHRLNVFRAGIILSAIIWGVDSFFVVGTDHMGQESFLIYILIGISSGSMISYSIDRISSLAYMVFALLPLLLNLALQDGTIYLYMLLGGLVYICFIGFSGIRFNQRLLEGVRLRHDAALREAEIRQLAFYDALTELPNRRLLIDRLQRALMTTQRNNRRGVVLFIDIDNFKTLNDTHGHETGDLLLKQVSDRLRKAVRQIDTVARLGGDEFVVMVEGLSKETALLTKEVNNIVDHVKRVFVKPYQLGDLRYDVTASIGVAIFGLHGDVDHELLKNADIAMYQAKRSGRNATVIYDPAQG